MPEVAVVIPAFNPGAHLRRSLACVLGQTMHDLVCVVVDDGSAEDLSWVADLDDERVLYHRQDNRGVSVARNVGVAISDSRFVAFLDQDDEWLPGKLARQVSSLGARPSASFSHTPFVWVLPTAEVPSRRDSVGYLTNLAGQGHVCLSSMLVPRLHYLAVGGNDPQLSQQQDWALVLNLLQAFGPPVLEDETLVRYHVHDSNASAAYGVAAHEAMIVLSLHAARARRRGESAALKAATQGRGVARRLHSEQAVDRLRASLDAGDWAAAAGHLGNGLRLDPMVIATATWRAGMVRFSRAMPPRRPTADPGISQTLV